MTKSQPWNLSIPIRGELLNIAIEIALGTLCPRFDGGRFALGYMGLVCTGPSHQS